MSETDLSYVSKTILNVLPSELDLTKEIKFSSYVQRREYVEVFPVTNAPASYTNSNLGTSVRIVLADPARWLDKRSSVLFLQATHGSEYSHADRTGKAVCRWSGPLRCQPSGH